VLLKNTKIHVRDPVKNKSGPPPKSGTIYVHLNTTRYYIKASDTIYIWKLKLVEYTRYLIEVHVRGICAWSRF